MQSFKPLKIVLFSESISVRPSPIPPNIRSLSWSASGSLIATCTVANIRIWSPEKPHVKSSTELRNAHPKGGAPYGSGPSGDAVEKIAFCPRTDNLLASVGHDGLVRLWDVRVPGGAAASGKGTPLAHCKVGGTPEFLTWHPNGTEMLVGRRDDVVHAVDMRRLLSGDVHATYELEAEERTPVRDKGAYNIMAFSNSGREVFATTNEGAVKILDYPSMSVLHTLLGHTSSCYTVKQSPVGNWVSVGSGDSLISLWDTHSWLCMQTLTHHTSSVRDLSYSFDGAYLVAGSGSDFKEGSAGMEVYHVDTGDAIHTVETSNPVTLAQWHPTRYWVSKR